MNDPRLRRHPLGFLEVVDRPTPEALAAYYAEAYYQSERSNDRRDYAAEELDVIRQRSEQRSEQALAFLRHDGPGRLLDVGRGEGFVLKAFAERGWQVAGIDFSIAGIATPAHQALLRLEALIDGSDKASANRFYAALAEVGLGRNLTAFLQPKAKGAGI